MDRETGSEKLNRIKSGLEKRRSLIEELREAVSLNVKSQEKTSVSEEETSRGLEQIKEAAEETRQVWAIKKQEYEEANKEMLALEEQVKEEPARQQELQNLKQEVIAKKEIFVAAQKAFADNLQQAWKLQEELNQIQNPGEYPPERFLRRCYEQDFIIFLKAPSFKLSAEELRQDDYVRQAVQEEDISDRPVDFGDLETIFTNLRLAKSSQSNSQALAEQELDGEQVDLRQKNPFYLYAARLAKSLVEEGEIPLLRHTGDFRILTQAVKVLEYNQEGSLEASKEFRALVDPDVSHPETAWLETIKKKEQEALEKRLAGKEESQVGQELKNLESQLPAKKEELERAEAELAQAKKVLDAHNLKSLPGKTEEFKRVYPEWLKTKAELEQEVQGKNKRFHESYLSHYNLGQAIKEAQRILEGFYRLARRGQGARTQEPDGTAITHSDSGPGIPKDSSPTLEQELKRPERLTKEEAIRRAKVFREKMLKSVESGVFSSEADIRLQAETLYQKLGLPEELQGQKVRERAIDLITSRCLERMPEKKLDDEAWLEKQYELYEKELDDKIHELMYQRKEAGEGWPDRGEKLEKIIELTRAIQSKLGKNKPEITFDISAALGRACLNQYKIPTIEHLKKPLSPTEWQENKAEANYRSYVKNNLEEQMRERVKNLSQKVLEQEADRKYREAVKQYLWVEWIDRIDELDWEKMDQNLHKVWDEYVQKALSILGLEEIDARGAEVVRDNIEVGSRDARGLRVGDVVRKFHRKIWDPILGRVIRPGEVIKVV